MTRKSFLKTYYQTSCFCCINDDFENYSFQNRPFDPTGNQLFYTQIHIQYQAFALVFFSWPLVRALKENSPIVKHRLSVFFYRSGLKKLTRQILVLGVFLFRHLWALCLFVLCFSQELGFLFT